MPHLAYQDVTTIYIYILPQAKQDFASVTTLKPLTPVFIIFMCGNYAGRVTERDLSVLERHKHQVQGLRRTTASILM